jgi:uncharacterized protein
VSKWTRRQSIQVVGIGVAMSVAGGMIPRVLAQPRTQILIGTAGKDSVFYSLGTVMAAVISKYVSEVDAMAPETNGTADNIKMLQEGRIELALAQADLAWAATQGQLDGLIKKVAVRTLLATHPRYLHLVTLADRGITVVGDLKGKRLSTGLAGGTTDVKTRRVLEAHGLTRYNLGMHEHLDDREAVQALEDGKLDAFALDAELPAPAIRELVATQGSRVRLIVTGSAVSRIAMRHGPFYFVAAIPGGTYSGVDEDIPVATGMTLRGGPGCLNNFSASISGASAGVRLPSGAAAS